MKRPGPVEAAERRAAIRLVVPAALILLAILWAGAQTDPDFAKISLGLAEVRHLAGQMLPPDPAALPEVLLGGLETLRIAVLGTTGCILFSLLLGPLASRHVSPVWLRLPLRTLLAAIRAVPMLVLAVLLVVAFGEGPMAGILAMAFHATGVLALHYATALDGVDTGPVAALESAGASRLQRLRHAVWPQVAAELLRDTLYRFEMNLRESLVLGLVGAGGIGVLFGAYVFRGEYAKITTLTLVVIAIVALIEVANFWFRRHVR